MLPALILKMGQPKPGASVPLLKDLQQPDVAITVEPPTDAEIQRIRQTIESATSRAEVRAIVRDVVGESNPVPLVRRLYPNQLEKQIFLQMLLQDSSSAAEPHPCGFFGFLLSHLIIFGLLCALPCLMIYVSAVCLGSWEHDVFLWVFCPILVCVCFVCLKYWGKGPFPSSPYKLTVPIVISGALINPFFIAACWVMFTQADYPYCNETAKLVTQFVACISSALFAITMLVVCYCVYNDKK